MYIFVAFYIFLTCDYEIRCRNLNVISRFGWPGKKQFFYDNSPINLKSSVWNKRIKTIFSLVVTYFRDDKRYCEHWVNIIDFIYICEELIWSSFYMILRFLCTSCGHFTIFTSIYFALVAIHFTQTIRINLKDFRINSFSENLGICRWNSSSGSLIF